MNGETKAIGIVGIVILLLVLMGQGCQKRSLETFDNCIKNHLPAECSQAIKGGF